MRQTFVLLLLLPIFVESTANAQESCQVRLILFLPSDVKEPDGYQERVDQIVKYSASFLTEGFQRWGHNDVVLPFRRTPDAMRKS